MVNDSIYNFTITFLKEIYFYYSIENNKVKIMHDRSNISNSDIFLFGKASNLNKPYYFICGILSQYIGFVNENEQQQEKVDYYKKVINNIEEVGLFDFEIGTIYYYNPQADSRRVRTSKCVKLDYDITIVPASPDYRWNYQVFKEDDETKTGGIYDSGWLTESVTIKAGTNFKLLFAKVSNEIAINSVTEILQYFYIVDYGFINKIPLFDNIANIKSSTEMPFIEEIHQGIAEALVPYNGYIAMKNAMDNGFRCVELDIRKSSDGELLIWHDPTIKGTLNGEETTLTIANETWETLSNLVISTHPTYGDQHLYKFNDCIDYLWRYRSYVNLDLKINNFEEVATVMRNKNMCGKGFYFNFSNTVENMNKVLAIDPLAKFGFSYNLGTLQNIYNSNFDMSKIIVWQYNNAVTDESVYNIKSYKCSFLIAGCNSSNMNNIQKYHPNIVEYTSMYLNNILAAQKAFTDLY